MTMTYRRFGRTEIQMPVLSAGFMRAMHSWRDTPMDLVPGPCQDNLEQVVRRALSLGINHLETARGYGSSERQLGRVLPKLPRSEIIVQTKVQPTADPDRFEVDFHDSLQRLNLEQVDLLAIHGINDHRSLWHTCRKGGCLARARQLQDKGKIGWVGFSGHGPTEVILDAVRHEEDDGFDYCNVHWYYIFQTNWPAIAEAYRRDMGVFVISATDKGGMLQEPPEILRRLSAPLAPMQFNDLFCLSRDEVTTISVGAARPTDFDAHLEAVTRLDGCRSLVDEIDQRWQEAMEQATGTRRPDLFFDTLPSWDRTPGYVNMPFILWLDYLDRGWGLTEYARRRYKKLGEDVPWIPGAKAGNLAGYDLPAFLKKHGHDPDAVLRTLCHAHLRLTAG